MPLISSKTHGIWDYVVGLVLIAAPWIFGFADNGPATWTPVAIGLAVLGLSLITNYEFSIAKVVPLKMHLIADMGAGLLLAASPWLFGFASYVYLPHLIVGLVEVIVAGITAKVPYRATRWEGELRPSH